jgi:hypothetical protein
LVGRLHDRYVESLAAHHLLMGCPSGANRRFDLQAGLVFEVWGDAIHRASHTPGRHESDLLRAGGLRIEKDDGECG